MKRADREAHVWLDKMRHRDPEVHRAGFDAWMESPQNAAAYARASAEYEFHKGLSRSRIDAGRRARKAAKSRQRWAFATILAAAIALGGAWLVLGDRTGPQIATNSSAHDETIMPDGTRIRLTGGARIDARFDVHERRIILLSGRARFEVARDKTRPFVVAAGGSETRALGTIFEIDLTNAAVPRIALIQGKVEVRGVRGEQTMQLRPGEIAEVPAEGPRVVKTTAAAAATPVRIEADQTSLDAVLAQANRQNGLPIRLADPALGKLEITGRFEVRDSAALARQLGAALDLDVEMTDAGPLLVRVGANRMSLPVKNP